MSRWKLVSRSVVREEERTSLYMESAKGEVKTLGALTSQCPSSSADLAVHTTKAASLLSDKLLQRYKSQSRPQSPSDKLSKHSGTESMLNSHLSWLHCFQSPSQRELGYEGSNTVMAVQTFPPSRRGKSQQMAIFTCCYTRESKRLLQLWNGVEVAGGWGITAAARGW